jgi:hypothetical protein
MRHKRAYSQFRSQSESLPVMAFGQVEIGRIVACDLTQ